jgi:prophage antirepressor-like protein
MIALGFSVGYYWTIKELALPSQSEKAYAAAKWASKQANKEKKEKKDAWNSKKNKLEQSKQDRKKKSVKNQKLQSQAGFADVLNYTLSFSDEF